MNARTMRVTKQPSEEIEGRRPERKTGRLDPVRKEEEEEEGGESQTENFLNILELFFPTQPPHNLMVVGREDPARAWGVQIFCFH